MRGSASTARPWRLPPISQETAGRPWASESPSDKAEEQALRDATRGNEWRERYGPWAVVTGASDGIGRAMALDLAARGLDLVLVARRQRLLDELAAQISRQHVVQTRVLPVDLATHAGVEAVCAAVEGLDVGLVGACAGFGTSGWFVEGDVDREVEMLDVNCKAVMWLAHHFGRRLAARGRGGLVLMSSIVAFQGVPRSAHYAATKAYVQTLAEGLRDELAPRGVDVVASAPGPVATGFASVAGMTMGRAASAETVAAETLDGLGRKTTVRPGTLAKVLHASLGALPRRLRIRVMARVMAGMTSGRPPGGPATGSA